MKTYDSNIPGYSKLYYHINGFKHFEDINDNIVYEILEMVDRFKSYNNHVGYEGYKSAVSYLTSTCSCRNFSFDTKTLFLILCCDPNLVHFYRFISTSIISLNEIEELTFGDEKDQAKMVRKKQLNQLEEDIKSQIGFYDSNLINFEFDFFKKFYSDKILLDNIKLDMMCVIRDLCSKHAMLKEISDKEITYLLDASDKYIKHLGGKKINVYGNTIAFNTFYQGEILGLFSNIQKLFFFISTIDRQCDAANLFSKSSTKETIYEIENLIGFYDEKFIEAEKSYKKIISK